MEKIYALFGIVCGVGEESGEETTQNPIREHDDNAIFIGIYKVVIKEDLPDGMYQLPPEVP